MLLPTMLGGINLSVANESRAGIDATLHQWDVVGWTMSASRNRRAIASVASRTIQSIALLRRLRGKGAWEIVHIFASDDGLDSTEDLLKSCVSHAGMQGADRIFLRLPIDSPLRDCARTAGFTGIRHEVVYTLKRAMRPIYGTLASGLRSRRPVDAHEVYRLYNSATPVDTRAAIGMTFEQWNDSRDAPGNSVKEYVCTDGYRVSGWLRLDSRRPEIRVDATLLDPTSGASLGLVSDAATIAPQHSRAKWLVPESMPSLGYALESQSWIQERSYELLASSTASKARENALQALLV